MRGYITTFFGCEECGRHFEEAAAASMDRVRSREEQVLWLWEQHNRVNGRLSGNRGNVSALYISQTRTSAGSRWSPHF